MQLLRLKLQNFRQHERTDLSLGTGLLAIVGPNGAGKSTLLEAIAWSLYGISAARGIKDTIKRRGAPPRSRVSVELEFSLGPHLYHLTRTLTNAELQQDGATIANSTAAVTDRVHSLLGMNREEFFNTYFTGQKELAVMAAMTPAQRSRFLSRVLGYEKLREAQDLLRSRRSSERAELAGLEQGLADPDELAGILASASAALEQAQVERDESGKALAAAKAKLDALEPQWKQATERRVAWQGLDGERKVAEGKVLAARTALAGLDKELAGAIDARNRCVPLAAKLVAWPELSKEREALDAQAIEVTKRSKVLARLETIVNRRSEIASELQSLPTLDQLDSFRAKLAEAVKSRDQVEGLVSGLRTKWKQNEQEARTKLDAYRERYRELREQREAIEEAGPNGTCPFCTRPLGDDFPRTIALLNAQMDELEASGGYYRDRVKQLADAPEELQELLSQREIADRQLRSSTEMLATAEGAHARRVAIESEDGRLLAEHAELGSQVEASTIVYDEERHQAVRQEISNLEPFRREYDQLAGLANRAEQLVESAAAAEHHATAMEAALTELDDRLMALAWNAEEFAELEDRVAQAKDLMQQADIRQARATSSVEGAARLREAAIVRQTDRTQKAARAKVITAGIERLSELDRAFGEIRVELNLQLRPDLADRASDLLRVLTNGRYADLELSEDYVPTVVEDGESKPVISGGEEDIINLALRLAISQMIADRAGQPLSMLVLDEIFGSLDEERRQSVVELLRSIGDRFPQVILISHVEGHRDAFDRVVRVEYDERNGVTSLHEEHPELTDAQ